MSAVPSVVGNACNSCLRVLDNLDQELVLTLRRQISDIMEIPPTPIICEDVVIFIRYVVQRKDACMRDIHNVSVLECLDLLKNYLRIPTLENYALINKYVLATKFHYRIMRDNTFTIGELQDMFKIYVKIYNKNLSYEESLITYNLPQIIDNAHLKNINGWTRHDFFIPHADHGQLYERYKYWGDKIKYLASKYGIFNLSAVDSHVALYSHIMLRINMLKEDVNEYIEKCARGRSEFCIETFCSLYSKIESEQVIIKEANQFRYNFDNLERMPIHEMHEMHETCETNGQHTYWVQPDDKKPFVHYPLILYYLTIFTVVCGIMIR